MKQSAEDTRRVVEIDVEVKSWEKSLPGVRELRPPRCPICLAPGVSACGLIVLHGHGTRSRQVWGPPHPAGGSAVLSVQQRRYACQNCRTIVVVRPRGVLARKRYRAAAIAMAMWLWGVEQLSDAIVRSRLAVRATRGLSRPERWTTLRRWAASIRTGELWGAVRVQDEWTLRACAERAARTVAALSDTLLDNPLERLFAGAAFAQ